MKDIFTSYYVKAQTLDPKEYTFLQISNSIPKWWKLPVTKIPELVPSWSLVADYKAGKVSEAEYTDIYLKELAEKKDKIDILVGKIQKQITAKNVVLLCYEKDGFCHRHIAGDMLNEKYGLKISELGVEKKKEDKEEIIYEQLSFFDR